MNHPSPEEFSAFAYDELSPAEQAGLKSHLRNCAECSKRLEAWTRSREMLQAWELPERSTQRDRWRVPQPLRTAVAAMLLIAVGYGIARLTSERIDVAGLRADLSHDLREQMRADLNAKVEAISADQTAYQQDLQQAIQQTVDQLAAQQAAYHQLLRKDMETVAMHTQAEFDRLASAEHPAANPGSLSDH